jgi:hypothetical protein
MENIQYFNLDHKIVFYVPSTKDKGTKIATSAFNTRTEGVAGILSDYFGGATIQESQGFYKTNQGQIIVENVKLVISYCSKDDLSKHSQAVLQLALDKCKEWTQESIGLSIDEKMYFIS